MGQFDSLSRKSVYRLMYKRLQIQLNKMGASDPFAMSIAYPVLLEKSSGRPAPPLRPAARARGIVALNGGEAIAL